MRRYVILFTLVATLFSSTTTRADDIVDTAVKAGKFNTLVTAVKAAGLVKTLKGKGPFTVFAPTDDAFAKIPKETISQLLEPKAKGQLTSILTYHVVPGRITAKDAFSADNAPTVNGQRLKVSRNQGRLVINESLVVATDIQCDNGVIHVIDTVLMPQTKSIPEVASNAGTFKTLLAAVTQAELAKTLSGKGPFTVFAPTDAAFAKLPKGTVESLLKPENRKKLVSILTYHVVSGRVYSDQAVKAEAAKTLQGQPVRIAVKADGVKVNDSRLLTTDIEAANGVIHVVDSVLLPKSLSVSQARKLLESSVTKGARAFNHGNIEACCKTYRDACQQIVDFGSDLPSPVKSVLNTSLNRAKRIKHAGERAWVLRHGIDLAYYTLED